MSAGRVEPTASDAGSADTGEPANSRGIESATEPSRAEPAAGTMQSLHSAEGASTPRAPEPADDDAPAATGWKDGGDIMTSLRSAWAANAEVRTCQARSRPRRRPTYPSDTSVRSARAARA